MALAIVEPTYVGPVRQLPNANLGLLSMQSDEDFAHDLDLMISNGLSPQGVAWLKESIRPAFQERARLQVAIDVQKTDAALAAFTQYYGQKYGVGTARDQIENARATIARGLALEAKFNLEASYISIWPFPNITPAERIINGLPVIFAFKLDGSSMDSSAEYEAYWGSMVESIGLNVRSNIQSPYDLALLLSVAPTVVRLLNEVNTMVANTRFTGYRRPAGVRTTWNYALQWPPYDLMYYSYTFGSPNEAEKTVLNPLLWSAINNSSAVANLANQNSATMAGGLPNGAALFWPDNLPKIRNYISTFVYAYKTELVFRYVAPLLPVKRKKKWWMKVVKAYIAFLGPIMAIASMGLATGLIYIAAGYASQFVAKQIGGVGGQIVGALASVVIGYGAGAAGFIPAGSLQAPSYSFTQSVMAYSPLSTGVNTIIGATLNTTIQNYIGISPDALNKLSTDAFLQAAAVVGSVIAPKSANLIMGSLSVVGNFPSLTTPTNWTDFVPAVKTTALAFAPQYNQEIRAGSELLKFAPDAANVLMQAGKLPDMLVRGMSYVADNLVKIPELVLQGLTYTATNAPRLIYDGISFVLEEVPPLAYKGTTFVMEKVPPLAYKGATFVVEEVPPLAYKGATFVMEKVPPLAYKGATFVVEEVPPLAYKAATFVVEDLPPLVYKGTTFVMEKAPPLAYKGATFVVEELPPLVYKGTTFVLDKGSDILFEGITETGKAIVELPNLFVKGTSFVIDKGSDILIEGTEEFLKAVIKVPELVGKGLGFLGNQLIDISLPSFNPSFNPSFLTNLPDKFPTITLPPTVYVPPSEIIIQQPPQQPTQTSSIRQIVQLPSLPSRDNTIPLLLIGGLTLTALVIAAAD